MKNILLSEQFVKIFTMAYLHSIYFMFFIETYKEFGAEYIDDETLTRIGSVGGVSISIMRIIAGFMLDSVNIKIIYISVVVCLLLQMATLYWS